ncbi:MAG: hypothetical protein IOD12_04530 [Silvanigrellales bacterium]|nr:hypothetical protein [Silvanigrellales bacterium]
MALPVARPFVSWSAPLLQTIALSAHELQDFTRSLVSGFADLQKRADPRFSREVLGDEGYLCALCVACQWDGLAEPVLEQTAHVSEVMESLTLSFAGILEAKKCLRVEEDVRYALLLELVSYRGRAWARLGKRDMCAREWAVLEGPKLVFLESAKGVPWAQRGLLVARAKVAIEKGVMALNQGHPGKALEWVEAALEGHGVHDVAAELRGLGVGELACIGLGADSKLKAFFAREKRILETSGEGVEAFRKSRARREIFALLSQESFEEAEEALERALKEMAGRDDLLEALLRQQKLQLHLIRDNCAAAEAELLKLETFSQARSFPPATFDLSPQRYELAFRQKKHEKLGEELRLGLAKALERDDVNACMSASMFLARWQLLAGQPEEARASILSALQICEKENYGADRVECLFHAMGVAHATHDLALFRDCALQAGKLSRKLGLSLKAACFEYILSLTSPARERSSLPLLELLRAPRVGKEAYYFLDYYGFLKGTQFEVRRAQTPQERTVLDERELRDSVLLGSGAWWFEDAGILLAVHNAGTSSVNVASVEFAKGSLLRSAFQALLDAKEGLMTEDVHALTSEAQYHPLRHASKVKTLVHRLRTALEPVGLSLPNARASGLYVLEGRAKLSLVFGPLSEDIDS